MRGVKRAVAPGVVLLPSCERGREAAGLKPEVIPAMGQRALAVLEAAAGPAWVCCCRRFRLGYSRLGGRGSTPRPLRARFSGNGCVRENTASFLTLSTPQGASPSALLVTVCVPSALASPEILPPHPSNGLPSGRLALLPRVESGS